MIVSALAHTHIRGMNWDDLNWERRFSAWPAYSQSKLANILHAKELAHRLENTGISVYVLHPGMKTINDSKLLCSFGFPLNYFTSRIFLSPYAYKQFFTKKTFTSKYFFLPLTNGQLRLFYF